MEKLEKPERWAPSLLERLLRPETPNVQKSLPEKKFRLPRLGSEEEPAVFTLRALPYGRVQELQELDKAVEIHILLAGCADPNLRDPALMEKFGAATPAEAVKCLLLPGEIADLSREVEKLCGYRRRTIEEVKNG